MIEIVRLEIILRDSLFNDEEVVDGELPEGAILVKGIKKDTGFAFHPERLETHREEVTEMLKQLPTQFRESGGGGWSFLNACNTKDGKQWTGEHRKMEELFMLGMGLELVKYQLPRDMWPDLYGGMPYISISVTD